MKALSVRQPWAELILLGRKHYELRSWRTSVRGRIWIHASQTIDVPFVELAGLTRSELSTGVLIGSIEILDCVPFTTEIAEELRRGGVFFEDVRSVSGFAWRVSAPERLALPIPYRGSLGFFQIPIDVAEIQV